MKFCRYYTANDWEFGLGFCFHSHGKAIPGYWTVRPASFAIMFGPWTFEWEKAGRCEIMSN